MHPVRQIILLKINLLNRHPVKFHPRAPVERELQKRALGKRVFFSIKPS